RRFLVVRYLLEIFARGREVTRPPGGEPKDITGAVPPGITGIGERADARLKVRQARGLDQDERGAELREIPDRGRRTCALCDGVIIGHRALVVSGGELFPGSAEGSEDRIAAAAVL